MDAMCRARLPAIRIGGRGPAILLGVLSGILPVAGCQPAMTQTTAPVSAPARSDAGTVADWPLTFSHHLFGVACFDTQTCQVTYNGFEFGNPDPAGPASALTPEAYDAAMTASYGPVARTTAPAEVTWRSKAGVPLQATVDIAALFADGAIRHRVPREDIPEGVSMGSTQVLLEVDDRTLRVYTRTLIPTRHEQIPGNRFSAFRNDLIQVHHRTY